MATWKLLGLTHSAVGVVLMLGATVAHSKVKIPTGPGVVRHIGDSKRGPYVVIDRGSAKGFVIGLNICLYNDLGQETGCGVIEHTNPKAAGIRLPVDKKTTVAEGNRAWSTTWGQLPALEGFAVEDSDDVNDLIEDQEQAEPEDPALLNRRISYQYVAMAMLPVTANGLEFNANARANGTGSLWTSGEPQSRSLIGMAVDFRLPRPGAWDTGLQFAYSFMPSSPVKTDYDLTDSSQKVESGVSAHFYRLGWNTGFALTQSDGFSWMLSGGFDAWLVSHRFTAKHSDETSLAVGSVLNGLVTLPVSTWTEFNVGGWTFTSGIDVQIPLFMRGNRVSGQVGYAEETTAEKDLSAIGDAISPQKRMGYALKLGLGAKI